MDEVICDGEASVANKTKPDNQSLGVAVFGHLTFQCRPVPHAIPGVDGIPSNVFEIRTLSYPQKALQTTVSDGTRDRGCCKSLFLWLVGRDCWMPNGVVPTAARAAYCLVMFPLKFEREVLLAQLSEIKKWRTH